ncbi:hypothetical protein Hanom_Chr09g00865801 [Helianthus anomalus]
MCTNIQSHVSFKQESIHRHVQQYHQVKIWSHLHINHERTGPGTEPEPKHPQKLEPLPASIEA